jgi:predicted HD phosphohydrolase
MSTAPLTRDTIVPFLLRILWTLGPEAYLDESVSMAKHMEQSAACAAQTNTSEAPSVAALLHEIGHFIVDFPLDALEKGSDNIH